MIVIFTFGIKFKAIVAHGIIIENLVTNPSNEMFVGRVDSSRFEALVK